MKKSKYKVAIYVNNKRADTVHVESDDELKQKLESIIRRNCRKHKKVIPGLSRASKDAPITEVHLSYVKTSTSLQGGRRPLPTISKAYEKLPANVLCPVARL